MYVIPIDKQHLLRLEQTMFEQLANELKGKINPKFKLTENNIYAVTWFVQIPKGTRIKAVMVSCSGLTQGFRFFYSNDGRIDEITGYMSRILNRKLNKMGGLTVSGYGFCHATDIFEQAVYSIFNREDQVRFFLDT